MQYLGIRLYYDEFADRHCVEGKGALTDGLVRKLWIDTRQLGLKAAKEFFWEIVLGMAERDRRHPVKAYLDGVQPTWDRNPRLDTWLMDYAGAEDTALIRAVGAIWMIAAVRRVRKPGCKFDICLCWKGQRNAGKSMLGATLASKDWFSDCLPIDAKPAVVIEQLVASGSSSSPS